MIQTALQRDKTAWWTFTLSFALHLLVIFSFNHADLFRSKLPEPAPYYVDIISLPVADPAPAGNEATAPVPLPPVVTAKQAVAPTKPVMTLPAKQPPAVPAKTSPQADKSQSTEEAREFSERLGRLERTTEARHQSAALTSLQKRTAEKKGAGAASTAGVNQGADYGAYIQSRLKDALSTTIVYQSRKPEAAVHLYIDRTGRLIKYEMIRPSADKLFNSSVIRSIEKAKADFPPVPSGSGFNKLYVFSPQEVSN